MPRFSIVIPTFRRVDTLEHSLRTAVAQTYQDVEIIVHDAAQNEEAAEVVRRLGDGRTRYVGSPHISMQDDWESALNASTGDYILCIGDDDGLLPDACSVAAQVLDETGAEILTWNPLMYFWPRFPLETCRDRLVGSWGRDCRVEIKSSKEFLHQFYRFKPIPYPGFYHGLTKRTVIERVRASVGRYMLGLAPDISSAIANMCFTSSYAQINRPLSINALSHNSYFYRCFLATDEGAQNAASSEAFSRGVTDPSLVDTPNLAIFLAKDMIALKKIFFPNDPPSLSYRSLLAYAHHFLPLEPSRKASMLADLAEIARRNDVDLTGIGHETFSWLVLPPPSGRHVSPTLEIVDADVAGEGVKNVADAARYCGAMLPAFAGFTTVPLSTHEPTLALMPARPVTLSFSDKGNGQPFLGQGWGAHEAWGIWSTSGLAEIVVPMRDRPPGDSLKVRLKGHRFVHANMPRVTGALLVGGRRLASLDATLNAPQVDVEFSIPAALYAGQRELRIELLFDDPKSPAEIGANSDHRLLSFGLHEMTVTVSTGSRWRAFLHAIRISRDN